MNNNANLLTLVQEALVRDSKLKSCLDDIYIFVNDGAVIISGSVPRDLLKVLAKHIVSSVPGVNLVIDDLRVEPARRHRVGVQIDWANGSMALV
ncbi:MAG TPA: BON domain-containing protein [Chryseosolibacter sp.]|nr:BON domain-containing protein [Chryseosolibacter sp.]